jgi:hypothetical protein
MNLFNLVRHYCDGVKIVKDWVGDGGIVVSPAQAQARADICLKCPMNVDTIAFEKEIAEVIKSIMEFKNHLKMRVKGEKRLHTCKMCACHLPTKVHVPLEYIMKHTEIVEVKTYPEKCWVRTEQNL